MFVKIGFPFTKFFRFFVMAALMSGAFLNCSLDFLTNEKPSAGSGSGSGTESDTAEITSFTVNGKKGSINIAKNTISVTLPYDERTNIRVLKPKIEFKGKSVTPASDYPQNFSKPVKYEVASSKGASRVYTVTVKMEENPQANQRTFYAQDVSTFPGTYYKVNSEKKYEGTHCIIYIENGSGITIADAQDIGKEYDNNIHNKITGAFGGIEDVDNNGKVVLLLLDIQDGYSPESSKGTIGGYFSPTDMTSSTYSNKADMLYIDIYPQVPKSEAFYSTIAHELQHLINYSQTEVKGKKERETWLNEGLSTAAEYLYKENDPCRRINYVLAMNYSEYYSFSPADIKQQETFLAWDNLVINYAQDFLFFQWLRIHAKDKENIYKRILNGNGSAVDTILAAVNDSNGIDKSFNKNANWDWKSLIQAWFASNYFYNQDFPGYKNATIITTEINKFKTTLQTAGYNPNDVTSAVTSLITPWKGWQSQNKTTVPLKNSQGILVKFTSSFSQTTGNITYTGLASNGSLVTDKNSFTAGMPIIVFNHDGSTSGATVNTALPPPPPPSRSAGQFFGPLLPVPVGIIDAIVP